MAGSLKDIVVALLDDPMLRKIGFTIMPAVAIGSLTYRAVRDAIRGGKLNVLSQDLPGGDAVFSPEDNTIYIGSKALAGVQNGVFGPATRAIIVHESVHAANHLSHRNLSTGDDEVAAYLVQVAYASASQPGFYRKWIDSNRASADAKILQAASDIVDGFGLTYGGVRTLQRTYLISLYQALANHPLYKSEVTVPLAL